MVQVTDKGGLDEGMKSGNGKKQPNLRRSLEMKTTGLTDGLHWGEWQW